MYALVIIERAYDLNDWPTPLITIITTDTNEPGTTKLLESCWQIDLKEGLSFFDTLLRHIKATRNIRFQIAYSDKPFVFANPDTVNGN